MTHILTDETMMYEGTKLHRVQYADGCKGGWVQHAGNIQQGAVVREEAKIFGGALIDSKSKVFGADTVIYGGTIRESHVEDSQLNYANLFQSKIFRCKADHLHAYNTVIQGSELFNSSFANCRIEDSLVCGSHLKQSTLKQALCLRNADVISINNMIFDVTYQRLNDIVNIGCKTFSRESWLKLLENAYWFQILGLDQDGFKQGDFDEMIRTLPVIVETLRVTQDD